MNKAIENIGKKVIDKFFDFDNNEYEFDGGCVEVENGVYEAPSVSISFNIEVGEHAIDCAVKVTKGKLDYVEAIFKDEGFENIQEALNNYIEKNLDSQELYVLVLDDVRENALDEWQRNGFRNEADYWHYRLSA